MLNSATSFKPTPKQTKVVILLIDIHMLHGDEMEMFGVSSYMAKRMTTLGMLDYDDENDSYDFTNSFYSWLCKQGLIDPKTW